MEFVEEIEGFGEIGKRLGQDKAKETPLNQSVARTKSEARQYAMSLAKGSFIGLKANIFAAGAFYYHMGCGYHSLPYYIRHSYRATFWQDAQRHFIVSETRESPQMIGLLEECQAALQRLEASLHQDSESMDVQTVCLDVVKLSERVEYATILFRILIPIMRIYEQFVVPEEWMEGRTLEEQRWSNRQHQQWNEWLDCLPSVCYGHLTEDGGDGELQEIELGERAERQSVRRLEHSISPLADQRAASRLDQRFRILPLGMRHHAVGHLIGSQLRAWCMYAVDIKLHPDRSNGCTQHQFHFPRLQSSSTILYGLQGKFIALQSSFELR